jgi:phytoene synthase
VTRSRLQNSYDACCRLARRAAGNFFVSFLGLPRDRFRAMCVLYAFLRLSDDIADEPGRSVSDREVALLDWREQLRVAMGGGEILSGEPVDVFPALSDVVTSYGIPPEELEAVLDGISMDLTPRIYATYEDLRVYCDRVAGAVGRCCLHVWGFHDPAAMETAEDCGMALQMTNILRDLGEDAAMGRIYLPQEDLDHFGVAAQDLAAGHVDEPFRELMRFEISRARDHYEASERLFEQIDSTGRPVLRAMLRVYGGLLGRIERADYDVFTRRVRLPAWRKALIGVAAVFGNS